MQTIRNSPETDIEPSKHSMRTNASPAPTGSNGFLRLAAGPNDRRVWHQRHAFFARVVFGQGSGAVHRSKNSPHMSALAHKQTSRWSAPLIVDGFRRRF